MHCIPLKAVGTLPSTAICWQHLQGEGWLLLPGTILSPLLCVYQISLKKLWSLPAWAAWASLTLLKSTHFCFAPQEVSRILRQRKGKCISQEGLEAPTLSQWWGGEVAPSPGPETSNTSPALWIWVLGVRFQTLSAGVGAGWRAEVLPAQSGSCGFRGRGKLGRTKFSSNGMHQGNAWKGCQL